MKIKFAITALCAALLTGCGVAIKYSLSGASIPPDAKTIRGGPSAPAAPA